MKELWTLNVCVYFFREHELLREELCMLQKTCDCHVARIAELEDELKQLKEELEELKAKAVIQDEVMNL